MLLVEEVILELVFVFAVRKGVEGFHLVLTCSHYKVFIKGVHVKALFRTLLNLEINRT